jgi:hypothetical protein
MQALRRLRVHGISTVHNAVVSDHDSNAWVFVAIASTLPEGGNRLAEVMDSADYADMATISHSELEHGVRDLMSAGLIGAGADPFALTETGRNLWDQVLRDYKEAYARTGNASWIQFAQGPRATIPCVANSPGWSVSQREWDEAAAAVSATFSKNVEDLRRRQGDSGRR